MLYAEHAMESAIDPVLIIDDEEDIARLLSYNLREAGLPNEAVHTAQAGLTYLAKTRPSVVILDLMLPDLPGTDVLKKIRTTPALADVGVLMLTARGDEIDRVVGFELGADDYVVKPFSVRELVLRVRALVRRTTPSVELRIDSLVFGRLSVDAAGHRAWVDSREVELTPIEFRLLLAFLQRKGRAVRREEVLSDTWAESPHITVRTVDTHVKRLRAKLGHAGSYLRTLRGVGYRWAASPEE